MPAGPSHSYSGNLGYKRGRVRLIGEHTVRVRPQFVDYVLRSTVRGQMFAVVEAKDDDQASELAKLCPAGTGYIEVRPIWEFNA